MTATTVLRDVTLPNGDRGDVIIQGEEIAGIAPARFEHTAGESATIIEAAGLTILPPLADPHVHLDKTLTIDVAPNRTGDLAGAIESWMAHRTRITEEDILDRARKAALTALRNGITALRTHVDTGSDIGVVGVRALVRLREELRDVLDLQIIAGHGLPVTGPEGIENSRVLRAALEAGADGVGGAPSLDADPVGAWRILRALAEEFRVPLDLHVDETLDPRVFLLDEIARDAADRSVPLTVDHIVSLSVQSDALRARVARDLADAEVNVVTLPQTNLFLQGRRVGAVVPRGLTALEDLRDAGVRLAAGADNVGDPFNPVGRLDPFETASLLVAAAHLDPASALDAVSGAARAVMGLTPRAIAAGAPADFVLIRATSPIDAIGRAHAERQVWRRGAVIADTRLTTRWGADLPESTLRGNS